jgi:hypothetical protein
MGIDPYNGATMEDPDETFEMEEPRPNSKGHKSTTNV